MSPGLPRVMVTSQSTGTGTGAASTPISFETGSFTRAPPYTPSAAKAGEGICLEVVIRWLRAVLAEGQYSNAALFDSAVASAAVD